VEFTDLAAILSFLVVGSGLIMFYISRQGQTKSAVKAGAAGISEMYKVYNTQVADVIKIKDSQIKRLNSKINELSYDDEPETEDKTPKLDGLKPLLASRGINPAILDMPFVKKLIAKYTKDMSLEDITGLAQQFGVIGKNNESGIPDESTASSNAESKYF